MALAKDSEGAEAGKMKHDPDLTRGRVWHTCGTCHPALITRHNWLGDDKQVNGQRCIDVRTCRNSHRGDKQPLDYKEWGIREGCTAFGSKYYEAYHALMIP